MSASTDASRRGAGRALRLGFIVLVVIVLAPIAMVYALVKVAEGRR
jgi:hypothetical protein